MRNIFFLDDDEDDSTPVKCIDHKTLFWRIWKEWRGHSEASVQQKWDAHCEEQKAKGQDPNFLYR